MHVLFYVGDKQWSGSSRATLTAARGLASRGHTVAVASSADGRLDRLVRDAGIEAISISASTSAGGAWDLRRKLKERTIDVTIVNNARDHLIVGSAIRFADGGGVLRRVPPFEKVDVVRSGKLARRMAAAGLVVSTQRELTEVAAAGWLIPPTVASLGVDVDRYDLVEPVARREVSAPPEGLLIACCYDPSGRQRMGTVFRMLALIAQRHADTRVLLFGPGSTDDDLRMHAAALGVGPLVSFLGEREDDLSIMRAAHAGWVVGSGDDGAYACLDFMALRVPVIAERMPLTQHFVAHNITGLLLAGGDPSLTASVVAGFFSAEDKRIAMGNAGRTRVQREFAETTMIDGFDAAVNEAGDRTKWAKT